MSHKALTPENGRISSPELTSSFNGAATDVSEIELKMLVRPLPDGRVNRPVFSDIKSFFDNLGWIRLASEIKRTKDDGIVIGDRDALLTRQLDTPDRALYKRGVTLRVRGNCPDADLSNVTTADICVKFGNTQDASGALRRKEFEARIDDFGRIDLSVLRTKYPEKDYPELHTALEGIHDQDLVEFYRPDVLRNRYLVEVPPEVTGLHGKKFFIELLLDEVSFVFDPKQQSIEHSTQSSPVVYHVDLEVEAEAMFKTCAYDNNPLSTNYVSSPMTKDELNQAMTAVQQQLLLAAGDHLTPNKYSKAERGFYHFDKMYQALQDAVELNADLPDDDVIRPAFSVKNSDGQKLHHLLPTDFGDYLRSRSRPIAASPFNLQ